MCKKYIKTISEFLASFSYFIRTDCWIFFKLSMNIMPLETTEPLLIPTWQPCKHEQSSITRARTHKFCITFFKCYYKHNDESKLWGYIIQI
jgi:hypothetical protein